MSAKSTTKSYSLTAKDGIFNLKDKIFSSYGEDGSVTSSSHIGIIKEGENIDIDNDGFWSLRPGRTAKKYTGAPHSLDQQGSGLFVDASVLKRLNSDYSATTIATMSNNDHMVYAKVPGRGIACSNGTDIGLYYNGAYTAFPAITTQYKRKVPGGQLLTWYNGTLYIARGSDILYSDPQAYGIMDTRNKKKRFKGYITLMEAVDDGLYISDSYDTFFYKGGQPHDMQTSLVADYPAIYGMSAKVERKLVESGEEGSVVYWLSTKGICIGKSGGKFANETIDKYEISDVPTSGTACFRNNNGIPQFIAPGIF
jgi:hypothetical protein